MKTFKYAMILLLLSYAGTLQADEQKNPADYINPFIGTTNGGNTNPGAVCPFGMMFVCPNNSRTIPCRWWTTSIGIRT